MNNREVDQALLRCLITLVEEGSVTRAGSRLEMSQPSVSHALRRLRLVFDDPVVVRAGSKMLPTPRGRMLAEQAREILERLARLTSSKERFDVNSIGGMFTLSAPEYVEHLLCPVLTRILQHEAPKSRLWIKPPDPRRAERDLETGEIDVRLGWVRDPSPSTRSRLLFSDQFVCLMRQGHPAATAPLTLERYVDLTHVRSQASIPSTASRLMDEAVGRIGATINVALVVPSHLTIGRVVGATDLVATVPMCIARNLRTDPP